MRDLLKSSAAIFAFPWEYEGKLYWKIIPRQTLERTEQSTAVAYADMKNKIYPHLVLDDTNRNGGISNRVVSNKIFVGTADLCGAEKINLGEYDAALRHESAHMRDMRQSGGVGIYIIKGLILIAEDRADSIATTAHRLSTPKYAELASYFAKSEIFRIEHQGKQDIAHSSFVNRIQAQVRLLAHDDRITPEEREQQYQILKNVNEMWKQVGDGFDVLQYYHDEYAKRPDMQKSSAIQETSLDVKSLAAKAVEGIKGMTAKDMMPAVPVPTGFSAQHHLNTGKPSYPTRG